MKQREKGEDAHGTASRIDILTLVQRLTDLEIEVKGIKDVLCKLVTVDGDERKLKDEGIDSAGKKKPRREKRSWECDDEVAVKNWFRYKGELKRHREVGGVVYKITKDWIWFRVKRSGDDGKD